MNIFASINDSLKTVHRNYQLLFIHFLFLFIAFFGLFFILSIPLGVLFVVFGIDLTDILKGSFIEIVLSSLKLLKKFLIFAVIFLLTLFVYLILVAGLWVYIFSGTLGIMSAYLQEGFPFKLRNFHRFGKNYFWKVGLFSIFSALTFILITGVLLFLGEITSEFVELIGKYSHALSTFSSVFIHLTLLILSVLAFLLWITYSLFGFYGFFIKKFSVRETIVRTKDIIMKNPASLGRAGLLFVMYILMGGVLLSIGSLLAIIPHVGTIMAAIYQFFIQFAHIYISLVVLAAFFSYYINFTKEDEERELSDNISLGEASLQEPVPRQSENPPQSQIPPPSEPA